MIEIIQTIISKRVDLILHFLKQGDDIDSALKVTDNVIESIALEATAFVSTNFVEHEEGNNKSGGWRA